MSDLFKSFLPACCVLALAQQVFAQQPPSAGSQLQQIQPSPVPPPAPPAMRIEQRAPTSSGADGADQTRIVVDTLRITGTSVFTESELLALTGFVPGRELSLYDLQRMAARITERYRRNGNIVAQAIVPAQDIRNNTVTIAVSEGRYGQVVLHNDSKLADRVARGSLGGLNSGDVITLGPLESRLLRLSDLPGIVVSSTLVPGTSVGTSDLIVDIVPGKALSGSVDADNAGNRYTGEYRLGATLYLNDPLGIGDLASLRVLTSGSGLQYARVGYQAPVGRVDVGVAYDWLHYSLGREFSDLHAHGTAEVASVFGRYALVRSRDNNLYVQAAFAVKTFSDRVDAFQTVTDKRSEVVALSLYGDSRDTFGGGGFNTYGVTLATGWLDIRTPAARAIDAQTLQTNGGFGKLSFNASRLQSLGAPFSLYGAISGQLASKDLDISEKMELGGINAVRAYPEGEAYGDQGAVVTLEGRMDLPVFERVPGRLQLVAFVDAGSVRLDKHRQHSGTRDLSGAGVGINWAAPGNFAVRSYYAHKLGSEPATSSPDRSGRFWIEVVKFF
jgi:hemolysin activation/secretion protein